MKILVKIRDFSELKYAIFSIMKPQIIMTLASDDLHVLLIVWFMLFARQFCQIVEIAHHVDISFYGNEIMIIIMNTPGIMVWISKLKT